MDHHAVADECVIRVEGVLDGVAAGKIEAMLARAKADARFVIDMSQVREFHDFGIAVLGHAMTRSAARVVLSGLRHHQVRLLRYFGIEAAAVERALLPDAASAEAVRAALEHAVTRSRAARSGRLPDHGSARNGRSSGRAAVGGAQKISSPPTPS